MPVADNTVDYSSLANLLHRSGSPLAMAELHGGLCGVLCASGRKSASGWLSGLIDDCSADDETLAELETRLAALGKQTWAALSGWTLEFEPLLPGDDSAIDQRAEALALWCHGFLAGLVIGGVDLATGTAGLSPETEELVRDFAEISRAGAGSADADDADGSESSLIELAEYVRVGTQYIFEELVGGGEASAGEPVIH